MTTAVPSAAPATIQPVFTDAERVALAGFLAGYRGLTREAYALDLRQFTSWCRTQSLALFAVRRADTESFARELEAQGRARATVTRAGRPERRAWPRLQANSKARFGGHAAGPGIRWCQSVRSAKARVTAAVRLETCSRR
jgi:hypothetical protein